ncbi:hypothetical protein GGD56_005414 [Rhizobium mongolense]|uniref:Uncharacterized protein n=2 Tax=Rhizobium mongolense TaxID=57676 RepID=A0ABR6IUF2_9HYPH|nr:hypothetical protein [Rhizobium mongolense]TVZ64121.1 hypothetical protein BCL32_4325 [Rhizobium mongolense USDA 1844]
MKLLIRSMKRKTRNIQPLRMFGGLDRAANLSRHRAYPLARGRAVRLDSSRIGLLAYGNHDS